MRALARTAAAWFRRLSGEGTVTSHGGPHLVSQERAFAPGYYVLVVHVRGPLGRGYGKLYADEGSGSSEERVCGLVTKRERPVFRIVWLPRGAVRVGFQPVEEAADLEVPVFRFLRVPRWFATQRMLRRLRSKHRRFRGQSSRAIRAASRARAREGAIGSEEALYRLYEETFLQTRAPGDYPSWIELVEKPAHAELASRPLPDCAAWPLISVLVPAYETDPAHLEACLRSVLTQSYPRWELCVVDDASSSTTVRQILASFRELDPRVKVAFRTERGHICRATNDALAMSSGDFVALLDHDDLLAPHALRRVAESIVEHPDAVLFYGDEDKLSQHGFRKNPHFKPRFNPELLLAQNYMGHLIVARTRDVRDLGGFRPGYEGSQDHDLLLRLTERLEPAQIVHLPHILYHWRESAGSTALSPDAKSYSAEAGLRAVNDALTRRSEKAVAEHAPLVPHGYRVRWPLPEDPPLVSILVPTRDALGLLSRCVQGVLEKTTYPRLELLVLDNGSVEPETLAYLTRLSEEPRVRILRDDRAFNFSALNNAGARQARGTVLTLLNNDIEVIDGDWLTEMVSHALRPEVGCVGAKLLYPDDTIQHAGVITGIGGVAGHGHKRLPNHDPGYFGRLRLTHAVSAVTGACLVVRREVFERVGGLDESLAVAFNDVDLCLKVRDRGFRNVFTPYAVLYHHESASRGHEDTPERQLRFQRERQTMIARWGDTLRADPYYSPHLSLEREDFSLVSPHSLEGSPKP